MYPKENSNENYFTVKVFWDLFEASDLADYSNQFEPEEMELSHRRRKT
jgi:hypothetical protein